MKKTASILLALVMLLALCSCTVKLSTTNTLIVNDLPGEDEGPKPYEEMTLEEKMEYKSVVELVAATDYSAELLAPALDTTTGLWGYINLQGEWKILPAYHAAHGFSGDYAIVESVYGDCSFIDRTGEVVLDTINKQPITNATDFYVEEKEDGTLKTLAGVSYDTKYAQTYVYVNAEGKTSEININKLPVTKGVNYKTLRYLELATPFRNGKAAVMRSTNASLIAKGDTRYMEIAYIIDSSGVVQASLPQGMDADPAGFDDNMNIKVTNSEGLCGLVSESGAVVIPCAYLSISHCEGDMYLVQDKDGLYGFMNKNGHRVIGFIYENALPFSEGLAAVKEDSGWGFINETGEVVIPCEFDDVKAIKTAATGSEADKGAFCSGIALASKGRYWAIIKTDGDILMAAEADECPAMSVCGNYVSFKINGAYGVITVDGKYVIKPSFGAIGEFR